MRPKAIFLRVLELLETHKTEIPSVYALTDTFHQGLYGLALVDTRGVVPFLVFSLANVQGTLDR
jgi:hypothetical protein